MNQVEKENKIKKYLKEHGYRPRDDKDLNNYIKSLKFRLGKEDKDLYIEENDNNLNIYIGKKIKSAKKDRALYIKVTRDEEERYKNLAIEKNTSLSKLVRNLLEEECLKN